MPACFSKHVRINIFIFYGQLNASRLKYRTRWLKVPKYAHIGGRSLTIKEQAFDDIHIQPDAGNYIFTFCSFIHLQRAIFGGLSISNLSFQDYEVAQPSYSHGLELNATKRTFCSKLFIAACSTSAQRGNLWWPHTTARIIRSKLQALQKLFKKIWRKNLVV